MRLHGPQQVTMIPALYDGKRIELHVAARKFFEQGLRRRARGYKVIARMNSTGIAGPAGVQTVPAVIVDNPVISISSRSPRNFSPGVISMKPTTSCGIDFNLATIINSASYSRDLIRAQP